MYNTLNLDTPIKRYGLYKFKHYILDLYKNICQKLLLLCCRLNGRAGLWGQLLTLDLPVSACKSGKGKLSWGSGFDPWTSQRCGRNKPLELA
jgi:hypothetical protein